MTVWFPTVAVTVSVVCFAPVVSSRYHPHPAGVYVPGPSMTMRSVPVPSEYVTAYEPLPPFASCTWKGAGVLYPATSLNYTVNVFVCVWMFVSVVFQDDSPTTRHPHPAGFVPVRLNDAVKYA